MHLLLLAALLTSIPPGQTSAPNRQPQLTSVPGLTALVFGSGNSIWFSASHDNGNSFSKPSEVARVPALALGRHRGPRVVVSGKAILVSAVYGDSLATGPHAHGLPANGDLVVWRSTDEGRSWSKPVAINDVPGSAREGLHSITVGDHGAVAAVWLDLRSPGTRLYGAYSENAGATWSKNVLLYSSPDNTVCQCCDPSLVSVANGVFDVMFRNVLHGDRDMYLTRWSLDGKISAPRKLGTGTWNIDACPMDGGGIAQRNGTVVSAWRRDKTVYLDQTGQPEIALGEGKDVAVAVSSEGAYVAWTNAAGVQIHRPGHSEPLCICGAGAFPALTPLPNGGVLAAWEQAGTISLQIIH